MATSRGSLEGTLPVLRDTRELCVPETIPPGNEVPLEEVAEPQKSKGVPVLGEVYEASQDLSSADALDYAWHTSGTTAPVLMTFA